MKKYEEMSRDELIDAIKKLKQGRRYGLIWEEHPENVNNKTFPMLEEVPEYTINQKGVSHLLLEGDNYHSLRSLLYTHKERVDVIYIDPPYNTGNKDFVYNDKIVDGEDIYRHSKWLSFMEKRLRLARELMAQDGVIFLSIDDNEMATLKLLCDGIFGEHNYAGSFIRKTRSAVNDKGNNVGVTHEYLLCYVKSKETKLRGLPKEFASYANPDNDPNGDWKSSDPSAKSGSKTTQFPITNPYTGQVDYPPAGRYWAFSKESMERYIKTKRIVFREKKVANQRGFLFKTYKKDLKSLFKPADTLMFAHNDYMNQNGTKDLMQLDVNFSYPKPVQFVAELIKIATGKKDAIVLDFFAGSGTTGQAILELNHQDGGKRSFILCTNNENNIAEAVTYKRIKNVMEGYKTAKGEEVKGYGGKLKYFRAKEVGNIENPTDKEIKEVIEHLQSLLHVKNATFDKVEEQEAYSIYANGNVITGYLKDIFEVERFKEELKKHNHKTKHLYFVSNDDETVRELAEELSEQFKRVEIHNVPKEIKVFFKTHLGGGRKNEKSDESI